VFRRAFYTLSLLVAIYFIGTAVRSRDVLPAVWPYFAKEEYELIGQDVFPNFPTPVVVHDTRGHTKWTVSIPHDYAFPLSIQEYADISGQCREVAARARDLLNKGHIDQTQMDYDAFDDRYVDVQQAQASGMLSSPKTQSLQAGPGHFVGMGGKEMRGKPICKSSMTFILESQDAGIGNTLMMLWTFYGLAKEEGRAFFIDDTRWAYGEYADIFQLPPIPSCRPPPRHHMVPCPFQAQHLVISSMTAKEVFPALLAKHHRLSGTSDEVRDVWGLARTGYEALFILNKDDEKYVASRIEDLKGKAKKDYISPNTPVIGIHVRRGDRHPLEYQYHNTYIPAEVFLEYAQNATNAHFGDSGESDVRHQYISVLASDDPMVHTEPDFASMLLAQERIRLASKDNIQQAGHKRKTYFQRFVEEAFGWEGGFYAPMFWNLGVERKNNAANAPEGVKVENVNDEARLMAPPSDQTLKLRSFIGRAYMMDLAVLSRASDSVVCAVSAMGCRLLGVMMDWEAGVGAGRWVNVDGQYGWAGIEW
jgi:hypothetical protein